jgi:mannose PTS system EIIA component
VSCSRRSKTIAGEQANFEAVSLDWDEECDAAQAKIGAPIARMKGVDGVLILTDTYGGTPCNLAMTFYEPGRVEVVSGVNLPMVLRLACNGNRQNAELAELAHWLETKGRQSICVAGDLAQRTGARTALGRRGPGREAGGVIERRVEIVNRSGLHARAAAKLVQTAGSFDSRVWLVKDGEEVDAKSILGLLLLAAARVRMVTLRAEGADEEGGPRRGRRADRRPLSRGELRALTRCRSCTG